MTAFAGCMYHGVQFLGKSYSTNPSISVSIDIHIIIYKYLALS